MKRRIRITAQFLLVCIMVFFAAIPGMAKVRRMPGYEYVEQGFMALTLDAEGAENFRYSGIENKIHTYRGRITPGKKFKLTMTATLAPLKSLPLTDRSYVISVQVLAKKGNKEIKKNSYKSVNKSNVFLDYPVPEDADAVEVYETFTLTNKSSNANYNKSLATRNRLILTASDSQAAITGAAQKAKEVNKDKASASKAEGGRKAKDEDGKSGGFGVLVGMAIAAAASGGGYFLMKKKKEAQTPADAGDRKINEPPKFCSNCGSKLGEGNRFCENCGAKV